MAEEVPVTVPATAEGVMEKPTAAADAPSPAKDASAEATKDQTMTEEGECIYLVAPTFVTPRLFADRCRVL